MAASGLGFGVVGVPGRMEYSVGVPGRMEYSDDADKGDPRPSGPGACTPWTYAPYAYASPRTLTAWTSRPAAIARMSGRGDHVSPSPFLFGFARV